MNDEHEAALRQLALEYASRSASEADTVLKIAAKYLAFLKGEQTQS